MTDYAGVYRAQCVAVTGNRITAYVPQVFGTTKVSISSHTGGLPKPNDNGWVLFESAQSSLPVWITNRGTPVGGTSVPVGVDYLTEELGDARYSLLGHTHPGGGGEGDGGTTDHGALTGLADDDHPQYAKEADLGTAALSDTEDFAAAVHSHTGVYEPASASEAQTAFHVAEGQPLKEITYDSGLPDTITYSNAGGTPVYSSTLTYVGGLPVLVELVRLADNETYTKTIEYLSGLPVSVEWATV